MIFLSVCGILPQCTVRRVKSDLAFQIMDWMEEFSTFLAPHADIFVASVKRDQRLKVINTKYDAQYPTVSSRKAKSVDFDELTVTFYYNSKCYE